MSELTRLLYPSPVTQDAEDWESRALSRVAARVEGLPPVPAEADDFGWEEGVLEKLRQRLNPAD